MNPTREELEHFLELKEVDRVREDYLTLLGENERLKKAICPECDKEEIEVWISLAEDGRHALDVNPELVDENEFRERQQNRLQARLKKLLDENERLTKKLEQWLLCPECGATLWKNAAAGTWCMRDGCTYLEKGGSICDECEFPIEAYKEEMEKIKRKIERQAAVVEAASRCYGKLKQKELITKEEGLKFRERFLAFIEALSNFEQGK